MRRHTRTAAALTLALLMAVAGCSDSSNTTASKTSGQSGVRRVEVPAAVSESPAATVSVRNGNYGKALVDDKDRTLYVFDKDTKNKSHCTGACAKAWPPLLTTKAPTAGSGVKSKLLKTTTRSDGKKQVTYNGHPLYRFDEDQKAGDINGQAVDAFGAKWYVISPKGKKITTKPTNNTGNGY
ncbi:COG4315 family predicted lipoprotein [Streptomyces sp. NPDC004980]